MCSRFIHAITSTRYTPERIEIMVLKRYLYSHVIEAFSHSFKLFEISFFFHEMGSTKQDYKNPFKKGRYHTNNLNNSDQMNLIVSSLTRTTKTFSIYSKKVIKLYQIETGASLERKTLRNV